MRNEILGTLILTGLAFLIGLHWVCWEECSLLSTPAENGGAHTACRGCYDRSPIDSGWRLCLRPCCPTDGYFSALAGGIALAIIMLPVLARTSEEMIQTRARHLPGGSISPGYTEMAGYCERGLYRGARTGIVTGIMLAIARIAGETAPLIFTALGNRFGFAGLDQPIGALPLQIWRYAISPYTSWHQQAWAAALPVNNHGAHPQHHRPPADWPALSQIRGI